MTLTTQHYCACGNAIAPARVELGYTLCLECGDRLATKQIEHKRKCTAPAYNKGAYQYIATHQQAKDIGR